MTCDHIGLSAAGRHEAVEAVVHRVQGVEGGGNSLNAQLLESLSADTRDVVLARSHVVDFEHGETIYRGDQGETTGVVLRGVVRISAADRHGRAVTYWHVHAGGFIGVGWLTGMSTALSAPALGRVRVQCIDAYARPILLRHADFGLAIAAQEHALLENLALAYRQRSGGGVMGRLAHELIELAQPHGGSDDKFLVIATHDELAEYVGTSREVVSRCLRVLCGRGLVRQVRRGCLELTHPIRLRSMVLVDAPE